MGLFKRRIGRVKKAILSYPYFLFFIAFFLGYLAINIWVNQLYVTFPTLLTEFRLGFAIPFLLFTFLIVPLLVALTINLSIVKFKDLKTVSAKDGGITISGVFAGVLGGACPGCFVGLFPAFLGLFGITGTLGVLPLFGLEIQLLSSIILLIAIVLLTRDTVCKVDIK